MCPGFWVHINGFQWGYLAQFSGWQPGRNQHRQKRGQNRDCKHERMIGKGSFMPADNTIGEDIDCLDGPESQSDSDKTSEQYRKYTKHRRFL